MSSTTTNDRIPENKLPLAQLITSLQFQDNPQLEKTFGPEGREQCLQDSLIHLSCLAEAVKTGSTEIFESYLEWAQSMLQSRSIPLNDLAVNVMYMDTACKQLLPREDYEHIAGYIKNGMERLKKILAVNASFIKEDNPLREDAKKYFALLLKGDRKQAQELILGLVKNGCPVTEIYEHIFQCTQYEVGLLWQTNKITVAHEHYCTAATQLIMASLYPYIFDVVKNGPTILACTVSGELHEMGIRMVADFFEMEGWNTYYMGASMPDSNIISAIKEQKAAILAISVTMPFHMSKAEGLIKKIRADTDIAGLKIIVGGYSFRLVPGLWQRIGADGLANSAKEAIVLANQLVIPN